MTNQLFNTSKGQSSVFPSQPQDLI